MEEKSREQLKDVILRAIDKNAKLSTKDLAIMLGYTEEEVTTTIAEMEADSVSCGDPT